MKKAETTTTEFCEALTGGKQSEEEREERSEEEGRGSKVTVLTCAVCRWKCWFG